MWNGRMDQFNPQMMGILFWSEGISLCQNSSMVILFGKRTACNKNHPMQGEYSILKDWNASHHRSHSEIPKSGLLMLMLWADFRYGLKRWNLIQNEMVKRCIYCIDYWLCVESWAFAPSSKLAGYIFSSLPPRNLWSLFFPSAVRARFFVLSLETSQLYPLVVNIWPMHC